MFFSGQIAAGLLLFGALAVKVTQGRTTADEHGLNNHLLVRTRDIPWEDVQGLSISPTLFGRTVVAHLAGGKRITLAAPRSGLLGWGPDAEAVLARMREQAAPRPLPVHRSGLWWSRTMRWVLALAVLAGGLVAWRPWFDSWWPGTHRRYSIQFHYPGPGEEFADRMLKDIRPADRMSSDDFPRTSSRSVYRDTDGGRVRSVVTLWNRTRTTSGVERAADMFAWLQARAQQRARKVDAGGWGVQISEDRSLGDRVGKPMAGDEVWRSRLVDDRTGAMEIRHLVRRGNVLIDFSYAAARPTASVTQADSMAKEWVGGVYADIFLAVRD